jgi:NADH-quinone oxidoreductase subunit C
VTDVRREVAREEWTAAVAQAVGEGHAFLDLLTAVDRDADGFEVVLRLWDPSRRTGVLLATTCPREDARVPSVVGALPGAAWHERATAEMFGIGFDGHDTQPLLLPAGFGGHPLRKDFALAARAAKRWPGQKEPGESDADLAGPRRRRLAPPGVPSGWETP